MYFVLETLETEILWIGLKVYRVTATLLEGILMK